MEFFGLSPAYFADWLMIYALFGFVLECIVLTCENRKLVLDRGFVHGPFCIIYSVGAVAAHLLLVSIAWNPVLLFLFSALLATLFELITAHVMIRLFGACWWDYSMKRWNYKGMISLSTSIGWGALGIFFFYVLDPAVRFLVHLLPEPIAAVLGIAFLAYYLIDFIYTLVTNIRNRGKKAGEERIGRLRVE